MLRTILVQTAFIVGLTATPLLARAETPSDGVLVDRVAVRFYSAEIGGPTRPRFITARILAFEARLEAMVQEDSNPTDKLELRSIRAALDLHVVEEYLSNLPLDVDPPADRVATLIDDLGAAFASRVGGAKYVQQAAAYEGIEPSEIDQIIRRRMRCALYIDHVITPILGTTEDQLREVYRTAAHPFRQVPFDDARRDLARWYLGEKLISTETSFLQAARSRINVIVLPKDTP